MNPAIERVSSTTDPGRMEEILLRDGVLIIERLLEEPFVERIFEEVSPWFERSPTGSGEWLGKQTRRVHDLLRNSEAIRENVCNPVVLAVMDRILGPWCDKYQLSSCSLVAVGPGETAQELHRDDLLYPFSHPSERIAHCVAFWAFSDFREENGATRVIVGSHRWDDVRSPTPQETVPAEMPRGSVLLTTGPTYHGGGANQTDDEWRIGMYTGYNLGWLKQEEAQFLTNPPEVARHYPERLQRLIGYQMHSPFLGWYDLQDPIVVLQDYEELSAPRTDDHPEGKTQDGRVILADEVRRA